MNEPRNDSTMATIIFLCLATLAILAITLVTEEPIAAAPAGAAATAP